LEIRGLDYYPAAAAAAAAALSLYTRTKQPKPDSLETVPNAE